jgi:hypothetical protein
LTGADECSVVGQSCGRKYHDEQDNFAHGAHGTTALKGRVSPPESVAADLRKFSGALAVAAEREAVVIVMTLLASEP